MSLTVDQIRLVTESYELIRLSLRPYAELFYHRLLLDHPFARAVFPDDMTNQIAVFSKTIDALVANVGDIVNLKPFLSDLGKKHVKYGVKAYQYEAVGTVLIDTFADILGERFTPATRQAWETVYSETAGVMISAADSDI
jgi:nitric oxide dioxygenase